MRVDGLGGVWLADPVLLLVLGVALFALFGCAHQWGLEPEEGAAARGLEGALETACDELAGALRVVVARSGTSAGRRRHAGAGGRAQRGRGRAGRLV